MTENENNGPSQQHREICCSGEDLMLSGSEEGILSPLFLEHPGQAHHSADCNDTQADDSFMENDNVPELKPQHKLLWALKNNRFELFTRLLEDRRVIPEFKYGKPDYGTCIEIACRLPERGKFVKSLLNKGVKPNIHEIHPEPIHYAAKKGNSEALEALLQNKKTRINVLDSSGRTALHHAVRYSEDGRDSEYERCIRLLLNRPDLQVNIPNKKGYTAVHEAAKNRKEAVELILRYRKDTVDLDTYKASGRTAREFISDKYPELTRLLPESYVQLQSLNRHSQLLSALQLRQQKTFHDILCQVDEDGKARVDPNYYYRKPYFATCLEIACREKDCATFVKDLLSAGADPNTVNARTKQPALHLAVETENHEVLSVLLEDRRTNVNIVNEEGKSIVHLIAEHYHQKDETEAKQCLKLILSNSKMNVNLCDSDGHSPLHVALQDGHKKIIEYMFKYGGSRLDIDGVTGPNTEKLRATILEKYPDLKSKLPASSESFALDEKRLFQHLYDKKCEDFRNDFSDNFKDHNDGNYTFLQYATLHSLKDAVCVLLEHRADPNAITDFEKRPPIIIACANKHHEILKLFFGMDSDNKLDVNAIDAKGDTALHYASRNRDLECVVFLLRHGASIKLKNVFNKPPLPAESVEYFLDKGLQPNDKFPEDEEYKIIFDYSFLVAHSEQNMEQYPAQEYETPLLNDAESGNRSVNSLERLNAEMDFLFYISRSSDHRKLMQHPVITSFLHMKWLRVRRYFYFNLGIYIVFALLLNCYILSKIGDNSTNGNDTMKHSNSNNTSWLTSVAWPLIIPFLVYFTFREIFQLVLSPRMYIKDYENFLDIILILLSGYILIWPKWLDSFVVTTILLSWTELILLTGRLPKLSRNIEMLKTVSLNYCWFLFSYGFLIIAFAFSFYSLLHKNANHSSTEYDSKNGDDFFFNPLLSVMKTFIMMMGEFEATSFMTEMLNSNTYFLLFALFMFIIAMVLLNLLTGLAVSDTQAIKSNADQLCLVSRIRLIYEIECTLLRWHKFVENWRKCKLLHPFINFHKSKLKDISLFSDTPPCNKRIHVLPNKGPNIVFECNGNNSSCKMDLAILGAAMGIISKRGAEIDINIMKENIDQIQESVNENHEKIYTMSESNLAKIQNKMEENQSLLKNYQQRMESKLTEIEGKLEYGEQQNTHNGFQKLKHKATIGYEKQNELDKILRHIEVANQETKELLNQILKLLQHTKDKDH